MYVWFLQPSIILHACKLSSLACAWLYIDTLMTVVLKTTFHCWLILFSILFAWTVVKFWTIQQLFSQVQFEFQGLPGSVLSRSLISDLYWIQEFEITTLEKLLMAWWMTAPFRFNFFGPTFKALKAHLMAGLLTWTCAFSLLGHLVHIFRTLPMYCRGN